MARGSLIGIRFGRLLVLSEDGRGNGSVIMYQCSCDCGAAARVKSTSLRSGETQSCGCSRVYTPRKHGKHGTSVYRRWQGMRERCSPGSRDAKNYWDRGIRVCAEWESFDNFYKDMGDPPPGMSLDRIDNDKGYSKENCRWATRVTQNRNRRGNIYVTVNGDKMLLKEACERFGVKYSTAIARLWEYGYDETRAFTEPVGACWTRPKRKRSSSAVSLGNGSALRPFVNSLGFGGADE